MITFFKNLFSAIKTFLDNKGVVWIGGVGGLFIVLLFMPKDWFWGVVAGVLGCLAVIKNIDIVEAWLTKQYTDIKNKVK